jgi:hypothetical protein
MTVKRSNRAALDQLANALVENILNATDKEVLAEAHEDYENPAQAATNARALFETAVAVVAKRKLTAAKAAVAADLGSPRTVIRLDPSQARRRLERMLARDPETASKLTLAARKGQGLSDEDVQGMLEDLEVLGIPPDSDDQN